MKYAQCGKPTYWNQRNGTPISPRPRGGNVFNASYRKDGIGPKRYIHVYDPVEGNPCYTLVTRDKDGQEEIGVWYCNGATELAAQFYVIQLEWITDKWRHDGRSGAWFSQKPLARH